jgi:hypothetical protein
MTTTFFPTGTETPDVVLFEEGNSLDHPLCIFPNDSEIHAFRAPTPRNTAS